MGGVIGSLLVGALLDKGNNCNRFRRDAPSPSTRFLPGLLGKDKCPPRHNQPYPNNGYNLPNNGYNLPSNGYNLPNNGYNLPNNGYNRPNNGYNRPNNGYSTPNNNGYNSNGFKQGS